MPFAKAIPGNDVVNGGSVVMNGVTTKSYDNTQRTQHLADTSGPFFTQADGRFVSQDWAEDRGTQPASSGDTNFAASGADAVVYLPGSGYHSHALFGVAWSYDSAPANGYLAIESPSGTEVFRESVTAAGPGSFTFAEGLRGRRGGDVVVRLANGNAAKRVSLAGRRVE